MLVVILLLLIAFVFGVWMGLCFYRRSATKIITEAPYVVRRR